MKANTKKESPKWAKMKKEKNGKIKTKILICARIEPPTSSVPASEPWVGAG